MPFPPSLPLTVIQYCFSLPLTQFDAGWSSLVARRAHNPKVGGSNPPPATNNNIKDLEIFLNPFYFRTHPLIGIDHPKKLIGVAKLAKIGLAVLFL